MTSRQRKRIKERLIELGVEERDTPRTIQQRWADEPALGFDSDEEDAELVTDNLPRAGSVHKNREVK